MKVFLIVFSVIVVAALAAVAATALTKRHAVADVQRETRSATGFNRIDVSGLAEVTLQHALVDACRAKHRRRRLEHRLLDSRHRQRRHRNLLTVKVRRCAIGRAHVKVVADQVLALAGRVTSPAQCHADPG